MKKSILILLGVLWYCQGCLASEAVGIVLGVVENVSIENNSHKVTAMRKTALHQDDIVRTGKNARAQLRFNDGTLTTLGSNTTFRIKQFNFSQKNQTNTAHFALLTGAFRTISGQLLKTAGAHFEVETPLGTIGIRGTDFWGGYLEADKIDVLLIKGDHAIEVKNANGHVLLTKSGEGTTLSKDKNTPVVKIWPASKIQSAVATIAWPNGESPTQ
jgi:hypothetical protein